MNWSMPRPVLQLVAVLLVLVCVTAFAAGVATAPSRGRLPGERLDGVTGQPLQAEDATPLVDERIEGPPPPPELTPEQKAKLAADQKAKAEAEALAKAEAEKGAPVGPEGVTPVAPPAPDQIGDVLARPPVTKPEDPPF